MVQIRRILCPTDFSEFSRRALEQAVALGRSYESGIVALHAIPVMLAPRGGLPFTAPPSVEPQARERLMQELQGFLEPARTAGLPSEALIVDGDPARRILEQARQLPADLIVMGTHGLGGFERLLLGSVTEKVLRRAACPVLTVPRPLAEAALTPHAQFKSVLCPIDFSAASDGALAHAVSLARESKARLLVLHVIEGWAEDLPREYAHFNVPEYRLHLEQEARGRLHAAVPEAERSACHVEELLGAGRAWREILRFAVERGADLIVMGVHGRSPIDIMLFGSTTQAVVRTATCPVLTIRTGWR